MYRAVEPPGKTIDFLLTTHPNAEAAKQSLGKVMNAVYNSQLRVINIDKNAADPKAINKLKQKKTLSKSVELRQNKLLNNRVE